ncbi:hypothetical protein [uncultured Boseongicola sp.]|uniref:hypothetical protein n=1 Tax=uncultured Boseongicola sp. TaxID=1648499 RepID=UPI00343F7764
MATKKTLRPHLATRRGHRYPARTRHQRKAIGNQGRGRVWLFLETLEFNTDHALIEAAGGRFEGPSALNPMAASPSGPTYGAIAGT